MVDRDHDTAASPALERRTLAEKIATRGSWRDPVELAELCLAVAAARDVERVRILVLGERSFLSLERGGFEEPLGVVPRGLGEATMLRLGILGAESPTAELGPLGRIDVQLGPAEVEILVRTTTGSEGPEVELLRIRGGAEPWVPRPGPGLPPDQLGHYTVLEEVGRGGAGVVYRAMHDTLEREAAVKLLDDRYEGRAEATARFSHEARAASRLDHPGFVRIYDFGMSPHGRPYMVMEHVAAPTLRMALDDSARGAFEPSRVAQIGAAVAEVLAVAHEEGIIHCDIKPENVFLLEDDQVKVGDFGAAQLQGSDRQLRLVGTPRYMAPELFRAEPASPHTDLYALGCVLFELLTGSVPFDPASVIRMARAHQRAALPEARSPHGPVPEAVREVIERCLAKEPERRPPNARWVQERLAES
ncbi:MAG: serine/threonine protein kinase [Deltaproteobacteria bacterium]|nr:serine/threonine protein kinase [Deltaproteobacteria bacterium]